MVSSIKMKKTIRLFIFSLFLVSVFAFTKSEKWYQFESTPFGFKMEFPAKPTGKTKVINSSVGELTINMFEYIGLKDSSEFNLLYMASYTEYPHPIDAGQKDKQKELCRKIVDDAVNRVQGKLLKETSISLNGYEGVESRIEYKNGLEVLKMRVYLVDNKMYMLETITEIAKDNNKSILRFMDSFKLVK